MISENKGVNKRQNSTSTLSGELMSIFSEVGIAMVAPLFVGAIAGVLLDKGVHIYPIGTLGGIGVGFVLSLINLVRITQKIIKNSAGTA